jgi:hypothetical protein
MTEQEMYNKLVKIIAGYNLMTDKELKLDDIMYITEVNKKYWDTYKWWLGAEEEYGKGYYFKDLKGKKVINGIGDNSIPYELFDIIENVFDAQRHHFG